ncbi:MAG: prepilin-type N-terminal cleavage/methylation domain-containing protein [Candidatus Omnitrophota bacterium]
MKRSFTLIELLIVLVIIGILATLALPSYNGYITKARNAEAISMLPAYCDSLWRNYIEAGTFPATDPTNNNPPPTSLDVKLPASTKYFTYSYMNNIPNPPTAGSSLILYALSTDYAKQAKGAAVGVDIYLMYLTQPMVGVTGGQQINTNWWRYYGKVTKDQNNGLQINMGGGWD